MKAWRQGCPYAVKVLFDTGEMTEIIDLRFRLETEILEGLNHHRIPRLVESFTHEGIRYIVQDFIHGFPLSYFIGTGRRFSEEEVKSILIQLLGILNGLQSPLQKGKGVVHRDLRLSNLLFNNNKIYLIDFGHARYLDMTGYAVCPDPPTSSSDKPNTSEAYRYQKPGPDTYRLLRREISPRSDFFGAGVVAVDLFTNWIEDESQFQQPWEEVLPLSLPFKRYVKKLLFQGGGFSSAAEALDELTILQ